MGLLHSYGWENRDIEYVLNLLTKSAVMRVFFINTAIKKASQADDYIAAVAATNALPDTATTLEVANAEQAEISAFRALVLLSS